MDASTPPSQTLTLSPTAMTLRASAKTSTEPWLQRTTLRTPPLVHELPRQGEILGHLGTTGRQTHHLRTTRLRNLCSYESQKPSSTRTESTSANYSRLSSETNRSPAWVRADALKTCTDRSMGKRSLNRSSANSLELVRTSWR